MIPNCTPIQRKIKDNEEQHTAPIITVDLGKPVPECQPILHFAEGRHDEGDGGDTWNSKACKLQAIYITNQYCNIPFLRGRVPLHVAHSTVSNQLMIILE